MKKRLRKKLGVGEFYSPWMSVKGKFKEEIINKDKTEYIDEFIDKVIEFVDSIDISFGGMTCYDDFSHFHHSSYRRGKRILSAIEIEKTILWYHNCDMLKKDTIEIVVLMNEKDENKYFKELDKK